MNKEKKLLIVLFNPELPEEEAFQCLNSLGDDVFQNPVNGMIADAFSALIMTGEKICSPLQIYEMSCGRVEEDKQQAYWNYLEELQAILQRHKSFVRCACPYAKMHYCDTCTWLLRDHIRKLTCELIISSRGRILDKHQLGES